LRETVVLQSTFERKHATPDVLADYTHLASNKGEISEQAFAALYGSAYEQVKRANKRPYTINSTLNDLRGTLFGKLLRKAMLGSALKTVADDEPERRLVARKMIEQTVSNMPLRGLAASSGGTLTRGMVEGFAMLANGQLLRGCRKVLRSLPSKKNHVSQHGERRLASSYEECEVNVP